MALHHIDDPSEQAVIDTDGDEQVTMPLYYQSLTLDQVTELQKLLHKFPQLTSDKQGCMTSMWEMLHQSDSSHTEFLLLCETQWKGT